MLDVGCGDGGYLKALRKAGHRGRLVGLDLSPDLIAAADGPGNEVVFVVGDMIDLPFPPASFDAVSARYSLDDVIDVRKAVLEIRRVLAAGGRLLRVANAPGHLRQFWDAVARATSEVPEMGASLRQLHSDGHREQKLAALAAELVGNVSIHSLERTLTASKDDVIALFDTHRFGFRSISQAAWSTARDRLSELLDSLVARTKDTGFVMDLELSVVLASVAAGPREDGPGV